MPGHTGGVHTCGFSILMDPDFENSKCVVLWGLDVEAAFRANYYNCIKKARDNGAKLIVIDPRKTGMAKEADIWMQVRPGRGFSFILSGGRRD